MPTKIKARRNRQGRIRYTATYRTPDGRWRSAGTYSSKREAIHAAHCAEGEAAKPTWVDPRAGEALLCDFAEQTWFSILVVEVKTRQGYESYYRTHVKPRFGGMPLGKIRESDVKSWLNELEAAGVARGTQRQAFIILGLILRAAQRAVHIASVATEGVKTRPVPTLPVLIFARGQWTAFLAALPEYWRPLAIVGVGTGLRESELRALAPCHINWSRQQIRVADTIVELGKVENGSRHIAKAYPKGKRVRCVDASDEVLGVLLDVVEERGLAPGSTEPFFVMESGSLLDQSKLNKIFRKACVVAGVPLRSPKHLRSTRASWLLKESGDLMYVKNQLGHASITTTEKYLAVVHETEVDNVTAFEVLRARRRDARSVVPRA